MVMKGSGDCMLP